MLEWSLSRGAEPNVLFAGPGGGQQEGAEHISHTPGDPKGSADDGKRS